MEYEIKHCPHCKGELSVPKELRTCICMYCGETIELRHPESADMPETVIHNIEENYQRSLDNIPELIKDYDQLLLKFTRSSYSASFEQYAQTGAALLLPAERYSALSEPNRIKVIKEVATTLTAVIESDIAKMKGSPLNAAKDKRMDQYRFFLAVYTVPMLRHLNYGISEPLADSVIGIWAERFPKYSFNKGTYENLQAGFERKGFCFITSAVCETLNKDDDCYELTVLREFRDAFMRSSEVRRSLIEEYYNIAPAIVASINMRRDWKETYKLIWSRYIQPCLKDIEDKRFESCERRYTKMVRDLMDEYDIAQKCL